jgi:hypothetical protein
MASVDTLKRGTKVSFQTLGSMGKTPARLGTVMRLKDTSTGKFVEIKVEDTKTYVLVRPGLVEVAS